MSDPTAYDGVHNGDYQPPVPIEVPSLEERREDIPALARHFVARFSSEQHIAPPEITEEAMAALQSCEWPEVSHLPWGAVRVSQLLCQTLSNRPQDFAHPHVAVPEQRATRGKKEPRALATIQFASGPGRIG